MFYNKPKGFRSSVRRGESQNNNFRKPFKKSGFNSFRQSRAPQRGVFESKLRGQVDIFIKKATQTGEVEAVSQKTFSDFDLQNPLKLNIQKTIPKKWIYSK